MKEKKWYKLYDLIDNESLEKLQNNNNFYIEMPESTRLFFKKIDSENLATIKAYEDVALLKQKTKKGSLEYYLLSRILRKLAK